MLLAMACAVSLPLGAQLNFSSIPQQTIDLYALIGVTSRSSVQTIRAFDISGQVSFKEYKIYLAALKKDSSEACYRSQLPDSTIGAPGIWQRYLTEAVYENYPVLGISWDNAMNFCRWKTIQDNKEGLHFIYRLPSCSEWLAASAYAERHKAGSFDLNYSDWLINTRDESDYNFLRDGWPYDLLYFHTAKDSPSLKRKWVIGDSYLYQQKNRLDKACNYYADKGYRHISFRCIKDSISPSAATSHKGKTLAKTILTFWKLEQP